MNPSEHDRERLSDYLLGLLEPNEVEKVEAELARSETLRDELARLRTTLLSLPEALEPETLPEGSWAALQAKLRVDASAADEAAPDGEAAPAGASAGSDAEPTAAPGGAPASPPRPATRSSGPRPRSGWWTVLPIGLALLLVATAVWGGSRARQAATLNREQRIVANWMRHPDMRVLQLTAAGEQRAGVVCILTDGRAMVLQPDPPPAGSSYVVYGRSGSGGAADETELVRGRGRLLRFQAEGLTQVSVRLEGRHAGAVGSVGLLQ